MFIRFKRINNEKFTDIFLNCIYFQYPFYEIQNKYIFYDLYILKILQKSQKKIIKTVFQIFKRTAFDWKNVTSFDNIWTLIKLNWFIQIIDFCRLTFYAAKSPSAKRPIRRNDFLPNVFEKSWSFKKKSFDENEIENIIVSIFWFHSFFIPIS